MDIIRGRPEGTTSSARTEHFTGTVWSDPVVQSAEDVRVGTTEWLDAVTEQEYTCRRGGQPRDDR